MNFSLKLYGNWGFAYNSVRGFAVKSANCLKGNSAFGKVIVAYFNFKLLEGWFWFEEW